MAETTPTLSIVVPLYNERENVSDLIDGIKNAINATDNYEIIIVDDGSEDGTVDQVAEEQVRLIRLTRNFGQTAALAAGIDAAQGEYIALMDGDLQHDPADIMHMLQHARTNGLDVVTGYREQRQDNALLRVWPSRIANRIIRTLSGVHIRDYGCSMKLFRASLAKRLELYGELHRFLPILSSMLGARMEQLPVKHFPRKAGRSKYGMGRGLRVFSDLLLMLFLLRYREKPMHLFGGLGIMSGLAGGVLFALMLVEKFMGNDIGHRPLFYISLLLIFMSVQLITTGFLADLVMRSYYASRGKKPYYIIQD